MISQWIFQPVIIITQSPAGVQAHPNPNTFAITFVAMYPSAGCPLGIPGNINLRNGPIPFVSLLTNPAFCAISISPIHRATTPAIVIHSEIASPALSSAAFVTSAKCPETAPYITANNIIPAHMKFNIDFTRNCCHSILWPKFLSYDKFPAPGNLHSQIFPAPDKSIGHSGITEPFNIPAVFQETLDRILIDDINVALNSILESHMKRAKRIHI